MALTFDDPQPESGKCLHTQESGDAGFSADLKHIFSNQDGMPGGGRPADNKGSSVRPVFSEAVAISELQEVVKFSPKSQPPLASEPADEEVADLKERKRSSSDPEEQPFQKVMEVEQETLSTPCSLKRKPLKIKQKDPLWGPGRRRTTYRHNRRIKWKFIAGMCCCILAVGLADVCKASPENLDTSGLKNEEASAYGTTCFTCMDRDRCPNLITIYAENDVLVYTRPTKAKIPKCSGAHLVVKNCSVCWSQSYVDIYCSNSITTFDAEASDGSTILNITKGCDHQQKSSAAPNGPANRGGHAHSHIGLICSVPFLVALMIICSALVVRAKLSKTLADP